MMSETEFHPAALLSVLAFVAVVATVMGMTFAGVYFAQRRLSRPATPTTQQFGIALALWVLFFSILAGSGLTATYPMPLLPVMMGVLILGALAFAAGRIGRSLSRGLTLSELVAFQIFRLPLELVLHAWAAQGTIPETMTWTGANFDIISGTLALLTAPLANRFRWLAWLFNLIGFALLINVMRVAVLSSPLPFGWGVQPPLALAMHLPYALILPVCVAGALAGHLILSAKLLRRAILD